MSSAHADYRRALELDPGNAEARRLCFQFDTKEGNLAEKRSNLNKNIWATATTLATTTTMTKHGGGSGGNHPAAAIPATTTAPLNTSATAPHGHQHPTQLEGTSGTECYKFFAASAPSQSPSPSTRRSLQVVPQRRAHHSLSKSNSSITAAVTCTTRAADSCRCNTCGAAGGGGGGGGSVQPSANGRLGASGRVSIHGDGTGRVKSGKCRRRPRQVLGKGILPVIDTRPPNEPEWGKQAASSAKASHDHLIQMRTERVGGVPARDDRLWGMLQPPRKGWGVATRSAPDSWSHAAAPPPQRIGSSSSAGGGGRERINEPQQPSAGLGAREHGKFSFGDKRCEFSAMTYVNVACIC